LILYQTILGYSKMVSEPPSRSIGSSAIRFLLAGHPPFISMHQSQ